MTLADKVEALNNLRHDDIAHSSDICILCEKTKDIALQVKVLENLLDEVAAESYECVVHGKIWGGTECPRC